MAPRDTRLAPTTSPALALRRILASCQADLRKHRVLMLRSKHPVGVHQTRVALRKMRAALGLFRAAVDGPVVRSLNAEARWLAGECGPARDLHVFLTETVEAVPPEIRRVAGRLEATYLQRARAALGSARFDAFDHKLERFMDLAKDAAWSTYLQRHLELQRKMDRLIEPLREHVRQALGRASTRLRQLAAMDVVLAQTLAARQERLLPTPPSLLQRRYEALRQAHLQALRAAGDGEAAADDPALWRARGAWLHRFEEDWRQALLAEVDLRLEPVLGMVEALSEDLNDPTP